MKKKKFFVLLPVLVLIISHYGIVRAQDTEEEFTPEAFYFDAVCFKSESKGMGRIDAYAMVPNKSLRFVKSGEIYGAQYNLVIEAKDSLNNKVATKSYTKNITEEDYYSAQGGYAGFDFTQARFDLSPGKYTVTARVTDNYTNKSFELSRMMTIIDFDKFNLAISGILLVSSIEETEERKVITPHISENISQLKDGFFAFFEVYNKTGRDSTDFAYQILNAKGVVVANSGRIRQYTGKPVTQHYMRVTMPEKNRTGGFVLRVMALYPSKNSQITENDNEAVAERSIKSVPVLGTVVIQDLNAAIKQLRYVATQSEIDYIEAGATTDEKHERFEEFWKSIDPTPNTERNEAQEEYYARIEYANRNYRSYTEGWRTDKGMVFIIYGEPFNIERSNATYSDGRVFERWTYRDNRQIIFVDNSGFGDFRLYSPLSINDKYRYGR